jgi:phage terminase large subunit
MAVVTIPYKPRDVFQPYHNRPHRFSSIVAHRRAGKTVAAMNDQIKKAINFNKHRDGRFAYVAPYRQQAKDVAWSYLKFYTAAIPGIEVSESELHVTFPNGNRVRLYGSDNYDAMRGIYLDDVILDEYADHHPQAWREVIRPALSDRQGSATFIGTSKGKNAFYDIHTLAEKSDDWFDMKLKASETGLIDQAELDAMRQQMSANEYAREMECDFEAAIEGAYYGAGLAQARLENRICNVAADPLIRLRAYADIGGVGKNADAFTIWICQFVGREIRVLNYYEAQGQELSTHLHWLHSQGYEAGKIDIYLPHDGIAEKGPYKGSWVSAFQDAGYHAEHLYGPGCGRTDAKLIRIEAARRLFPAIWFDNKAKAGIDAIASYHEKRDEKRGIGLGPDHDWASHGADAFGLMAVAYEEPRKAQALQYNRAGVL